MSFVLVQGGVGGWREPRFFDSSTSLCRIDSKFELRRDSAATGFTHSRATGRAKDNGTVVAAVESDTDDGASSITDEPLSSPLADKGRRNFKKRTSTSAIPKTASRLHPHAVKRHHYAKGPTQIERPGDAIRASYGKFGLDAQRLIIVPEAQPFSPLSLFMSSAAKVGAKLIAQRMKVLQKRRDELLASLPAVDDLATGSADIDLIKVPIMLSRLVRLNVL
ncbi:hypothetical protein LTR35_011009 [Friedmanniomyces endolithicus]|uniref:Uncharacterized protein n=1 Tax=Friedmanniomyces endolithicus TaxID=329885 RepID=A0AAN6F5W9_9PEZI|nr:hypothetical protein LTS00_017848 [Friedmanniomyces endolithicus]KAK0275307.1 hypothetical protein LTR35_011009 [Friedmanniomyces endolithicus]KAK0302168.1 hypothetical protein LTR82_017974 [Friedmanniomyces endolithicus]KAK0970033.1 hypothetical protein LTR54_018027 [Friedmanniomyces endolithicus]